MKLFVQIPALNEEKTIAGVIENIPRDIPGIAEVRVLVIDDGSTDRTGELAAKAGALVVRHEQPRGVGAAFKTGIEKSTELGADVIVTIDADGQFNPGDIPKVVDPIIKGEADFVTASRFIDKSLTPDMPGTKKWGNEFMARWISSLVNQRFYDVSCGFRAYSRNAFMRLVLMGEFTYTHETFLSLAFARVPIKEIPIKVRGTREHGQSRVASNLFHYGRRTAMIILKTYRDYRPLRFFSHLAVYLLILSFGFGLFLLSVKLRTGGFTPHKWAGFVAAALSGTALTVYLVGVVAEMLDRIRVAQDEILFRVRRLEYTLNNKDRSGGES
ncbi:MAG: glycosyltransferase family 2 protein [Lentisphaerota bacterium]